MTANADSIRLVNMSLGEVNDPGSCTDGGLHQAVCTSVAAGVTYVVAAGNDGVDAGTFVPAAYAEVITISAIVNTDGRPGGLGGFNFFYGVDDTLAAFSNYGAAVDLAAPGVDINSTYPGGGYATNTGTSMASPHVAGAAAVYLFQNPGASPANVKAYLQSIAWAQGSADGFGGDVDGSAEALLNAGAVGGLEPLTPPPTTCSLGATSGPVGSSVKVTCSNLGPSEWVKLSWDTSTGTQLGGFVASPDGSGVATVRIPDSVGGNHAIIV